MGKRVFDIFLSGSALVGLSPFLLFIAVLVKLTSKGPVFFKQERMGKGSVPFWIFKFRTMIYDPEGPLVTSKNDPRITPVGRKLRRFKLDELPQLYNVLRGDMSFVGPRPKIAGHEQQTLVCKPGITGAATVIFAQEERLLARIPQNNVESFAIEVLNHIKAQVDREYEQDSSLSVDLRIIFETPLYITGLKRAHFIEELTHVPGKQEAAKSGPAFIREFPSEEHEAVGSVAASVPAPQSVEVNA